MRLRKKLKRVEQIEDETFGVLTLPDGTSVRYRLGSLHKGGDLYEAFLACMDGWEHGLLPCIRQMDTREGSPDSCARWRVAGGAWRRAMELKDKLTRLERAAGAETIAARCVGCGEETRIREGILLDVARYPIFYRLC